MKLELKHLLPYLPYGIKVYNGMNNLTEILHVNIELNGLCSINVLSYPVLRQDLDCIELVLTPLSKFKKYVVGDIKKELGISHDQCMEFFGLMDGEIQLENISLGLYNAMCKNLIDFNNLIKEGLAVDKTNLKTI